MESQWFLYTKKADFEAISRKFNIDPVVARIIRNRDVITDAEIECYLNGTLDQLYDPHLLKDADRGAKLLLQKVKEKKKIRAITDYDIDGVQSSVIVKHLLKRIGAEYDCVIPRRIEDGYGISVELIKTAIADGVDTIITCDNGISAIDAIQYAKDNGLTVIVTDHHEMPYEMVGEEKRYLNTAADVVINPKQPDCPYPFQGLCGAAVIWKFMQVVYDHMKIDVRESFDLLENVAFATVGDVMDLIDENRIIVKYGLEQIHATKQIGLNALIDACGLAKESIKSYHIGFVLGPCINASGRLETAYQALSLLEETDPKKAKEEAEELVKLNNQRKEMTEEGIDAANKYIEENHMENDCVLVIYLPLLHESLNGIVAGKITEKYYRPTFVLSDAKDGIKGSGRSIEDYSMYDELVKVKECLVKFGGHPMAAGISLKGAAEVKKFREALLNNCSLTPEQLLPKTHIDVPMPISYINFNLVNQLDVLEPFGTGNKKPVFAAKDLIVRSMQIIGSNQNSLKIRLCDENGYGMDALLFHQAQEMEEKIVKKYGNDVWKDVLAGKNTSLRLDIIYYPSINEFRNTRQLQIIVSEAKIR